MKRRISRATVGHASLLAGIGFALLMAYQFNRCDHHPGTVASLMVVGVAIAYKRTRKPR